MASIRGGHVVERKEPVGWMKSSVLTPLEKVQKINTAKKEGKVTRGILLTVLKI